MTRPVPSMPNLNCGDWHTLYIFKTTKIGGQDQAALHGRIFAPKCWPFYSAAVLMTWQRDWIWKMKRWTVWTPITVTVLNHFHHSFDRIFKVWLNSRVLQKSCQILAALQHLMP